MGTAPSRQQRPNTLVTDAYCTLAFTNNLGVSCTQTGSRIVPSTPVVTIAQLEVTSTKRTPNWKPAITTTHAAVTVPQAAQLPQWFLNPTSALLVTVGTQIGDTTGDAITFYVPTGCANAQTGNFTMTYPFSPPGIVPAVPPLATLQGNLHANFMSLVLTGFGPWAPTSDALCASTPSDYNGFVPVTITNSSATANLNIAVTQRVPTLIQPAFSAKNTFNTVFTAPSTYAYSFLVPPNTSTNFSWPPSAQLQLVFGEATPLTWTFAQLQTLLNTSDPPVPPAPLLFTNAAGIGVGSGVLTPTIYPAGALAVKLHMLDAVVVQVRSNIRAYFTQDTTSPLTGAPTSSGKTNTSTTTSSGSSVPLNCTSSRAAGMSVSCNAGSLLPADKYSAYLCDVPTTYTSGGLKYPSFSVSVVQSVRQDGSVTAYTVPTKGPIQAPYVQSFSVPDYGQCTYVVKVVVTLDGVHTAAQSAAFQLGTTGPLNVVDGTGRIWALVCLDANYAIHVTEYVPVGTDGMVMDPFNVDTLLRFPIYANMPEANLTPGVPFSINMCSSAVPATSATFITQYSSATRFAALDNPAGNINKYPFANFGSTTLLPIPQDAGGYCQTCGFGGDTNIRTVRTPNGSRGAYLSVVDPHSTNSLFTFDVKTDGAGEFLALRSLKYGYQGFAASGIASVGHWGAYMCTDTGYCKGQSALFKWTVALSENARSTGDVCLLVSGVVDCGPALSADNSGYSGPVRTGVAINNPTFPLQYDVRPVFVNNSGVSCSYFQRPIFQVVSTHVFAYDTQSKGGNAYFFDFLLSLYLSGAYATASNPDNTDDTPTTTYLPPPAAPAVTVFRLWLPYGPLIAYRNNWQAGVDVSASQCINVVYDFPSDGNTCGSTRPFTQSFDYGNTKPELFPFRSMFNLNVESLAGFGVQTWSDGCSAMVSYAPTCFTPITGAPPGTCKSGLSTCVMADTVLGSEYACPPAEPWTADDDALQAFVTGTCLALLDDTSSSGGGIVCTGIAGQASSTCTGFTSSTYGSLCGAICSDTAAESGHYLGNDTCDNLKSAFCQNHPSAPDCACMLYLDSSYATDAVVPPMTAPSTFQQYFSEFQQRNPITLENPDTFWPPCTAAKHALRLNSQVKDWPDVAANCFASLYDSHIGAGASLTWDAINSCAAQEVSSSGSSASARKPKPVPSSGGRSSSGHGTMTTNGLSTGAIAGIVAGSIALVILVVVVVLVRRKRGK